MPPVQSPRNGIQLDVGHYVAGIGGDPVRSLRTPGTYLQYASEGSKEGVPRRLGKHALGFATEIERGTRWPIQKGVRARGIQPCGPRLTRVRACARDGLRKRR